MILKCYFLAILRLYSLGADKRTETLESAHLYNFNGNPDQLDYQPITNNLPHDTLCQRHQSQRNYPTLPNKVTENYFLLFFFWNLEIFGKFSIFGNCIFSTVFFV